MDSKGYSLIELLVALLLLSFGLIYVGGFSIKALQISRDSLYEAKALSVLENTKERLLIDSSQNYEKLTQQLNQDILHVLPEGTVNLKREDRHSHIQVCWYSQIQSKNRGLNLDAYAVR